MHAKDHDSMSLNSDYISNLPDECLACIFQSLERGDRKRCSLVCRRWLQVEGQSRCRLSLNARSDLLTVVPSLFSRFDSVTKLALKCDRRSPSISDDALIHITLLCRGLTRLKLRGCRGLTEIGISALAKNCKVLKKLSCSSCTFGTKAMKALLENCSSLEELSMKRLRGITDEAVEEPIGPGVASSSLKYICLKDIFNAQSFGPLITSLKNLRTLKIFRCSGNWDDFLEVITDRVAGLVDVHLERIKVSDTGLAAIANCSKLESLHIVKTPECTNEGLKSVAEHCKLLRKLHIDGWNMNRICDEGLIAVATHCFNLKELILISVNATVYSLDRLGTNCPNLERLGLCGSETVGDEEISCIATKCIALKKLCIKACPISDLGIEALVSGCPNLVKVKVKQCSDVTSEGAYWLRARRGLVAVDLDTIASESQDSSGSDRPQEVGVENPQVDANFASSSTSRSASFRARLSLLSGSGRNLVACTVRRWSDFSGSTRN